MLNDPDHDHDSRANGDRPPRAVCIHDPLAITPADAPRREVLAALAKAEADESDVANQPGGFALDVQRAHEALGRERTALCELHIAVREWLTDPSGATWAALAAVHPDFRRALDGWTTAGARMRHPEATPEVAPYSWIMRDLSAPNAVTRYTLARRRDNLVLVVDAHDDRRRIRDLDGATLPSTIEVDELAAGDHAATPDLLATIEDTLADMAPEGHEVERVRRKQADQAAPAQITAGEIARLRALEARATPGIWRHQPAETRRIRGFAQIFSVVTSDAHGGLVCWSDTDGSGCAVLPQREADHAFISEARNALVPLLDALEGEMARSATILDRCAALELALLGGADSSRKAQVAAPPLPPGTHGVTVAALSTDPPVALLTFEPLGVLGEDAHPEHDETVTVICGTVVVVRAARSYWLSQPGGATSTRIPAGKPHTLRAGVEGALVLVAMTKGVKK